LEFWTGRRPTAAVRGRGGTNVIGRKTLFLKIISVLDNLKYR